MYHPVVSGVITMMVTVTEAGWGGIPLDAERTNGLVPTAFSLRGDFLMADVADGVERRKPILGYDEATIDDKGRLLMGRKKRERLGENFVMTLGMKGILTAYPREVWEGILDDIETVSATNPGRQQYSRSILGHAEDELNCDGQGRVVIPSRLRKVAGLEPSSEVILLGCGERMEIWTASEYERYTTDPEGYGTDREEMLSRALGRMGGLAS